jgi:hypothetical protein
VSTVGGISQLEDEFTIYVSEMGGVRALASYLEPPKVALGTRLLGHERVQPHEV